MNKYDTLLKLFCYNEDPACDREWLREPMNYGDHNYGTNREALIKVPVRLCESVYKPAWFPKKDMTFNEIEARIKPLTEPIIIPVESITEILKQIERVTGTKDCPVCNGTGQVEDDEFIKANELTDGLVGCLNFEGYGLIDDLDKLVWPDGFTAFISIAGYPLQVKYVSLMEAVCRELGSDNIILVAFSGDTFKTLKFTTGEVTVFIAALGCINPEGEPVAKEYELRLPELLNH